jgi:hypothetical protein
VYTQQRFKFSYFIEWEGRKWLKRILATILLCAAWQRWLCFLFISSARPPFWSAHPRRRHWPEAVAVVAVVVVAAGAVVAAMVAVAAGVVVAVMVMAACMLRPRYAEAATTATVGAGRSAEGIPIDDRYGVQI